MDRRRTFLQLDSWWVLTVLEKVAKKAKVPNKSRDFFKFWSGRQTLSGIWQNSLLYSIT